MIALTTRSRRRMVSMLVAPRRIRSAAMPAPELLLALLRARGPSGREDEAARVWRETAASFAEVSTDGLGSSFARVGSGSGPLLAIVGHVDEIGLAVTHVDDAGFVFFRRIGGWSGEVLVGQRVEILTRGGVVPAVAAPKEREPIARGGAPKRRGALALGGGPAIGRGLPLNPRIADLLFEIAEAEGIAVATEVYAGATDTDADAVHLSRAGIPTGLVSIPQRNTHMPVELVDLADVEACVRLLIAFAARFSSAGVG